MEVLFVGPAGIFRSVRDIRFLPRCAQETPARGLSLATLSTVQVTFTESVNNVVAGSLIVDDTGGGGSATPATTLSGTGSGPYLFGGFGTPNDDPDLDISLNAGSIADAAVVWAVTDEGIRGFIVEKDMPGFTAQEIERKFSLRASVTSALYFDNVRVPKANVLPGVTGLPSPL